MGTTHGQNDCESTPLASNSEVRKLYITITNPTLKSELFYSKEKMMDILNKEFKQPTH
jgi:hypothetical protein